MVLQVKPQQVEHRHLLKNQELLVKKMPYWLPYLLPHWTLQDESTVGLLSTLKDSKSLSERRELSAFHFINNVITNSELNYISTNAISCVKNPNKLDEVVKVKFNIEFFRRNKRNSYT